MKYPNGQNLKYRSLYSCQLAHPSVIFRVSAFKNWPHPKIYDESEDTRHIEDYVLWTQLLFPENDTQILKLANLEEVLLRHRKHKANASGSHN